MVFTRASYCESQAVASLMPTEIVVKGGLPWLATNFSMLEVQMLFLSFALYQLVWKEQRIWLLEKFFASPAGRGNSAKVGNNGSIFASFLS